MSKRILDSDSPNEEAGPAKWQHIPSIQAASTRGLHCNLPPHSFLTFASIGEYESHYRQNHTNRCLACGRNFPMQHFLDLHLSEHHDPLVSIQRSQRGKTYKCLVEGCDKVTLTPTKRRQHLIDKHMYPRNYDFAVIREGIDGKQSLLRADTDERDDKSDIEGTEPMRHPSKSCTDSKLDLSEGSRDDVKLQLEDATVETLTEPLAALQFAPRQVRFGRRKKAGGFEKS